MKLRLQMSREVVRRHEEQVALGASVLHIRLKMTSGSGDRMIFFSVKPVERRRISSREFRLRLFRAAFERSLPVGGDFRRRREVYFDDSVFFGLEFVFRTLEMRFEIFRRLKKKLGNENLILLKSEKEIEMKVQKNEIIFKKVLTFETKNETKFIKIISKCHRF